MKNNNKYYYFLILFFLPYIFIFNGCASYTKKASEIQRYYSAGNYQMAKQISDESVNSAKKRDKYLLLLERGKINLVAGDYTAAIKDFQEAEQNLLDIEGTFSVSEQTMSIILDDTVKTYEANAFEQTMLSPYLAISYLQNNDIEGAFVERNRTINKITEYIEKNNLEFFDNTFARCLSAVLYLSENKSDDVRIEFKKINQKTGLSEFSPDENRINELSKTNGLYLFIETGLSPIKIEKKDTIPVGTILINVVYPIYQKRGTNINYNEVLIDDSPVGNSFILYNLEKMIMEYFEKVELPKIMARVTARATSKAAAQVAAQKMIFGEEEDKRNKQPNDPQQIEEKAPQKDDRYNKQTDHTNTDRTENQDNTRKPKQDELLGILFDAVAKALAMAEKADTRSWQTLPSQIHFFSIANLSPGKHKLTIISRGFNGENINRIEKDFDIGDYEKHTEYIVVPK